MPEGPRRSRRLNPNPPPPSQHSLTPRKRQYIEISSSSESPQIQVQKSPSKVQRNVSFSSFPVKDKTKKSKSKTKESKGTSTVKKFVDVAVGPDNAGTANDSCDGIQMMKDVFETELTCSLCFNCGPCGHCYCEYCLMRWMTQSMTCPECRARIEHHALNKIRTLEAISTKVQPQAFQSHEQFAEITLSKQEALERQERKVKEETLCTGLRHGRENGWREGQGIPRVGYIRFAGGWET